MGGEGCSSLETLGGGVVLRLRDVMIIEVFKPNLCGPTLLPTIEAWPLILHVAFIMC